VFRCLLVDDSPPFLKTARGLLEREHIAVVGMALTGAEALELSKQVHPDVVLVDIDIAGGERLRSGEAACRGGSARITGDPDLQSLRG
jgi:DNA-binding NarL/FixJ family response regulator